MKIAVDVMGYENEILQKQLMHVKSWLRNI